jgi:hypothetical protein
MLDEDGMATQHVTCAINSRTLNSVAQFSAIELVRMLYGSISGMMVTLLICIRMLDFREDSMVIDVGEPADWVKINVRQTVSSTCLFYLVTWCTSL